MVTSSLSSILGGLGLAAYAAANSFMDATVFSKNSKSEYPWISVNWDAWNFDEGNSDEVSITPSEGIKAFENILSLMPSVPVAVSTTLLDSRMDKWVLKNQTGDHIEKNNENVIYHSRPDISNKYSAPEDETEKRIAAIWKELLGIEAVGVDDNFFELGGHSLLATQLLAGIHKEMNVEIPLKEIFGRATIKDQAAYIKEIIEDIHTLQ